MKTKPLKKEEIDWEKIARDAGWEPYYSGFTRHGVSIAYVNWEALCISEGLVDSHAFSYR